MSLPRDLPASIVAEALARLDAGHEHAFGAARRFHVIHDGKVHAPKAVLGVAAELATGRPYGPGDFSGGEGHANARLRDLGFQVIESTDALELERARRDSMAAGFGSLPNGGVTPEDLQRLTIRPMRTGQGVFRDLDRTRAVAPPAGVTVSLLDIGAAYGDSFDDDGGIYYYPTTKRPAGRDAGEVEATKNAKRLQLPVFVILPGRDGSTRTVRSGWVAGFNDEQRIFLISFTRPAADADGASSAPFQLRIARPRDKASTTATARPGQNRFRFDVLTRYGCRCALCAVSCKDLLEAAHLCPVADGGCDDARNGLVLCRNHHRALDRGLLSFNEDGNVLAAGKESLDALGVLFSDLSHLKVRPAEEALAWRRPDA